MVLPCETFAESSNNQLHSAYPTLLRYHRALCLVRQDDRIRPISQASNVKKLEQVSLSRLESCKVGKLPISPFETWRVS